MSASLAERYRRYWLDFAIPRGKLVGVRVALFAVLGVDAFLQIAHAPRYGAGGFNVSHFPWLDPLLPMPGRAGMLMVLVLQCYLAFRMALGTVGRTSLVLLAGLYGYAYFISQLDSYQHHYLVFLLLVLSGFVPWRHGDAPAGDAAPVRSWAVRLVMVQLAIVYAWAAVSKLDPLWLDGSTLEQQLRVPWMRALFGRVLATDADPTGFALAAKLVLAAELVLAVAWPWRRLWPLALFAGVGLHAGIALTGLEIGAFSYLMFALYILVIPDPWVERVARPWRRAMARVAGPGPCARAGAHGLAAWRPALAPVIAAGTIIAGAALLLWLPFPEMRVVAAMVALLAAAQVLVPARLPPARLPPARSAHRVRVVLGHMVACAAVVLLGAVTDQVHDHYKFWGGSSRRLGDEASAEAAYRVLARISPEYGPGHYHLAEIERRRGHLDQALRGYRRAQQAAPSDYRPFLAEALIHDGAGRGAEAVAAARQALALEPRRARDRQRARAIVQRWAGVSP